MNTQIPTRIKWSSADAYVLHTRLDGLLVEFVRLDLPLTTAQQIELGTLHTFIVNVHSELAWEGIHCVYMEFLRANPALKAPFRC